MYCFTFYSEIYSLSRIYFLLWCELGTEMFIFLYEYLFDPTWFTVKTFSPTFHHFQFYYKASDCICVEFLFFLWIYLSILMPIHTVLIHWSFKIDKGLKIFIKENIQMSNELIKKHSTKIIFRENQSLKYVFCQIRKNKNKLQNFQKVFFF